MTNRSTVVGLVLGCLIALTTLSSASADLLKPLEVNAIPAAPPDHRLAYGNDANQFGQLFLPQGRGPFPVAVVIHGGCWKKFADLKNTLPMSDALRKVGIETWNIEYRRVDNEGGGCPGTYRDIGAALLRPSSWMPLPLRGC